MKESKLRIQWIDALRGYGAIMVVMCHLIQRLLREKWIESTIISEILLDGARAVQLFFLFTGFSIFLSLQKNEGGYRSYLKRRCLAIMPAYGVAIILTYIVGKGHSLLSIASGELVDISLWGMLVNFLCLNGLSPTYINTVVVGGWYVGVIWLYYLIAPMLFRLIQDTSCAVKFVGIAWFMRVGCHLFNRLLVNDPIIVEWLEMSIFSQIVFIALGQLLYFMIIKGDRRVSKLDQLIILALIAYVSLGMDSLMFWAMVWLCVIAVVSSVTSSALVNPVALTLGKYSYEVFLLHNIVLVAFGYIRKPEMNQYFIIAITWIAVVCVTLVAAIVVHKCIDRMKNILISRTIK